MSYILDALRKAEHERHLGQPPNPATSPTPAQPAGKQLWLWLGAGLGLGFNAALLAYFLIRPQPTTGPAATAPAASAHARPESTAPTVPLPARPESTAPIIPVPARPESIAPAAMAEPPAALSAAAAPPRKNPAGKPAPTEPSRPPVAAGPSRRQEPSKKPGAGPSVTIGPEPPPLLDTLPANARRSLPSLNLDIHVYSADAGKRFVVVNGQRYREGDPIGENAVLETVTANGAILRQGGQRFRLSVRR
jgi:general secretion pathway protein B